MDGHRREVNERLSGYAGAEPKVGDVIEFGLNAGVPLVLRAVVRSRTKGSFGVELLAETPDQRRNLSLFRQFVRAAAGYTDA